MKLRLSLTLLQLCAHTGVFAQTFDVIQAHHSITNDLHSDGTSGQTFVATASARLKGIRLFVEGRRWSPSYPHGSGFTVKLHRVVAGKIQSPALTSGTIAKDTIQLNTLTVVDVYFTNPYFQNSGDVFAFTIFGTSGGGGNGYNHYGMANNNAYTPGTLFYTYMEDGALYMNSSNLNKDFAFYTIIEPPSAPQASIREEKIALHRLTSTQNMISLANPIAGRTYMIQRSTDMKTWLDVSSKTSTGRLMEWTLTSSSPSEFYRVRVP